MNYSPSGKSSVIRDNIKKMLLKKSLSSCGILVAILFMIISLNSFVSAGGDCWDNGNPLSVVSIFGQSLSCTGVYDGPDSVAMMLGVNWKGGCSSYLVSDYAFHPERYETRGYDDEDSGCFCKYGYAVFPHSWEGDDGAYWYKGSDHYCEPIKFDKDNDGFYVPHEDYTKPIAWPWGSAILDWTDRYYIPEPYDIDDDDPDVCPTCPEICDGKDNNGDDVIDEGCPIDNDEDGVFNDTDCDDDNPNVWQNLAGYIDSDKDGYGSGNLLMICTGNNLPDGFSDINTDCNDNNALIHPNAQERCDGVDNDCNALTVDGSGEQAPISTIQQGVCLNSIKSCTNGQWNDYYFNIPLYEAVETSCDLTDNDCDGIVDEGCGNATVNLYIDGGYLPNVIYNTTQAAVRFKEHYVNGSGNINVPVKILLNGIVMQGIPSLPFSEGEKDWGIGFGVMESGNYNLTILVDPMNIISETNESDNVFQFSFTVYPSNGSDITPPSSISNLQLDSKSTSSLKWGWTNPCDYDFAYSIVYLDGVNVMNTSDNFYIATNLDSDTYYTITVHTVDFNGNINNNDVSNTAKTDKKPFVVIWSGDDTKKIVQDDLILVPQDTAKTVIHGSYSESETLPVTFESKTKTTNYWPWLLVLILFLLILLVLLLILNATNSRK
ncbi:MAG: MopE-related protein [Nanoarchaeota archaeon]